MKFSKRSFIMGNVFMIFAILSICSNSFGQTSISKNKKQVEKIISLYEANNFQGVRLCRLKRNNYLVCCIEIQKTLSSDLDRLAMIQAQRAVNEFLNGTNVSSVSSTILEENSSSNTKSNETESITNSNKEYTLKMIDKINTNSSGFVSGIESVYSREIQGNSKKLYVFVKEIL